MGWNEPPKNAYDDFERFFQQLQQNSWLLLTALIILIAVPTLFSSYYTVQPDEEAVVLRLGKYLKTSPPGFHLKLPFGIDESIKVKTKLILQEEFGFRTRAVEGSRTSYSNKSFDGESLMLTGDLNVADVEWITQFQIREPQKFLFNTKNPVQNIRDISEAIMRRVVGDRLVNDVLTVGRQEIADIAKQLTQQVVDRYDMGVRVVSIKLQDVNPPDPVKPSFNDVNAAKQEQEQAINQAEKKYNQVIPEARGKAEETVSRAEGYAVGLINRAEGDAERFTRVLAQYKKAPEITRDRLYIEKMESVLKNLKSFTVVDPKLKGVIPLYKSSVVPVGVSNEN